MSSEDQDWLTLPGFVWGHCRHTGQQSTSIASGLQTSQNTCPQPFPLLCAVVQEALGEQELVP
jgi:hypothetical protein